MSLVWAVFLNLLSLLFVLLDFLQRNWMFFLHFWKRQVDQNSCSFIQWCMGRLLFDPFMPVVVWWKTAAFALQLEPKRLRCQHSVFSRVHKYLSSSPPFSSTPFACPLAEPWSTIEILHCLLKSLLMRQHGPTVALGSPTAGCFSKSCLYTVSRKE